MRQPFQATRGKPLLRRGCSPQRTMTTVMRSVADPLSALHACAVLSNAADCGARRPACQVVHYRINAAIVTLRNMLLCSDVRIRLQSCRTSDKQG